MRRQPFNSLRWRIYVFNSVVNTKLPAKLSHRRSTTVSLEIYPIYSFIMKQVCVLEVRSLGSRLNGGPSLIVFFPWDLSYFQNVRAGVAREWTKSSASIPGQVTVSCSGTKTPYSYSASLRDKITKITSLYHIHRPVANEKRERFCTVC